MGSADLRDAEDLALGRQLDVAGNRRVAIQGQVRPRQMIVREVIAEDALEVPLAEYHHLIETLPIKRSTKGFCQGEPLAVLTSSIPRFLTRLWNTSP